MASTQQLLIHRMSNTRPRFKTRYATNSFRSYRSDHENRRKLEERVERRELANVKQRTGIASGTTGGIMSYRKDFLQ